MCTAVNAPSPVWTFLNTSLITAALNMIQPDPPALSAVDVFSLWTDVPASIADSDSDSTDKTIQRTKFTDLQRVRNSCRITITFANIQIHHKLQRSIAWEEHGLKMIGKDFYSKWVKSSFEYFITTQTRVDSTNGWIISQNTEILKFYFSTISGNLRNLWRHLTASFTLEVPLVSSFSAFIQ